MRRGLWIPPKKKRRERGGEKTTKHERWALGHLMRFFGDWTLVEIDVEAVDEYRAFKVKESERRARAIERGRPQRNEQGQVLRPLSARSINRTIDFLQWVLSVAIEYKRFGLAENAAEGKRRRLRERRPAPVHIDSAAQVEALLEAATELDRDPHCELAEREPILATLFFSGPRAHELCNLLWRDVDLVFPTLTGSRRDPDNLRERVLASVLRRADELLEHRGLVPLPRGLTSHKLRHAFASILVARGEDPVSVMRQIGHSAGARRSRLDEPRRCCRLRAWQAQLQDLRRRQACGRARSRPLGASFRSGGLVHPASPRT